MPDAGVKRAIRTRRFGREAELDEVRRRLASTSQVTVTGAPGVGKSRVVAEVAATWPHEVALAPLGGVRTAADAAHVVARALGLSGEAPIARALAARPGVLLVLDDAEDVEGLGARVDEWVGPGPEAPDGPRVLVATRRRLGRPGEQVVDLGPLDEADAVAVLVERARAAGVAVQPDDPQVVALVRALDGLPLALELAASRIRLVAPSAWVDRLSALVEGGRDPRHASLQVALEASWATLPPQARRALARATRFRGTFDLQAFEAVTGADPAALDALSDASWVRIEGHGRLRLLRPIRRFAEEHLPPEARPEVDRAHAAWAVAAGEAALAEVDRAGWGPVRALHDDLAAARAGADRELAARALVVLAEQIAAVGPLEADLAWIDDPPPALRRRLGLLWARIRWRQRRFAEALVRLDAVEAEAGPAGDLALLRATCRLGLGETGAARIAFDAIDEAAPIPPWERALVHGTLLLRESQPARAVEVLQAALVEHPPARPRARLHATLGSALRACDQLERAVASFHHAAAADPEDGWVGIVTAWTAVTLRDLGHAEAAAAAAEAAAGRCARAGDRWFEVDALVQLGLVRVEQGALDEARRVWARCRGRAEGPRAEGQCEVLAAWIAHRAGALDDAVAHYRAADALLGEAGSPHGSPLANLALAMAPTDPDGARVVLGRARQAAGADPHEALAVRVVEEALDGRPTAEAVTLALGARRAGLRMLLALTRPGVRVAGDGAWFETAQGVRVDLTRRRALRRVLAALAASERALSRSEVVEAGWPGERLVPSSAAARVHVAISSLRRLGLGAALETGERDGEVAYRLTAAVVR